MYNLTISSRSLTLINLDN